MTVFSQVSKSLVLKGFKSHLVLDILPTQSCPDILFPNFMVCLYPQGGEQSCTL